MDIVLSKSGVKCAAFKISNVQPIFNFRFLTFVQKYCIQRKDNQKNIN